MDFIKKIIREELQKVLSVLNETDFYKAIETGIKTFSKDSIIHDYEQGRVFAGDNLEVDITNLNMYHLIDYLPKSDKEESWSFEYETVAGGILIVDVIRKIYNNKSYWSLKFGQLYRDQKVPSLITDVENIEGYENFINVVNSKVANRLDPSKN